MSDVSSQTQESPSAGNAPEPKRRKLRKGTQSCWECKRRKIRCTFAVPTNAICDGCKRRGTACISQEFPDEPTSAGDITQVGNRLSRVEALVEQLAKKGSVNNSSNARRNRRDGTRAARAELRCLTDRSPGLDIPTPSSFNSEAIIDPKPRLNPCQPARVYTGTATQNAKAAGKYDELSTALLAAWPSQRDLDLILNVLPGISLLLQKGSCMPSSKFLDQDAPSPRDILQLPPPGSHPVLIAKKLLTLGTLLQDVPSSSAQDLAGLDTSYHDIAARVVETATSLVTRSDELVGSVEGIECLMMESMYQNNAGNLRCAWLTIRRALMIAQLMGLHRNMDSSSLKVHEPESRLRVSPEYMWLCIVRADRYLSLTLGLPQGSIDNSFATSKALEGCTPTERMQRIECHASGRILQHNEAEKPDSATLQEIDKLLQKAASCMPPQWWLAPDLALSASSDEEAFSRFMRIMNQITHYSLLLHLHLPYMLRSSANGEHDYSKITAVNASREMLARFLSFHRCRSTSFYCRGLDFFAFTASTALCLAHIDASRQLRIRDSEDGKGSNIFNFLSHQRLGDRGMMENALEGMEDMARTSDDGIASKIGSILRHLLVIEADAANGGNYSTNSSAGDTEGELEYAGKVSGGGKVLHIHIPYFGIVKIERRGVSKIVTPMLAAPVTPQPSGRMMLGPSPLIERQDGDEQLPPALANHSEGSLLDGRFIPSQQDQLMMNNHGDFSFDGNDFDESQLFLPELTAGMDDWALQGVEMAFFDNLFRGVEEPDMAEGE